MSPGRPVWPDHAGAVPLVSPLQPSVVYRSADPDALDRQYAGGAGYTYAREGHPNADVLAGLIDGMEGASGGFVTGSGMAAISAMFLGVLKAGDHVVGADQLYGRTLRMMTRDLPRLGITTTLADVTDASSIRAAIRPETKLVVVEVMSNPTIRIADMAGIVAATRDAGVLLAVDNTFTTPALYRPLAEGADIVLHSVTKLLSGHSDATLGYVAARDPVVTRAMWEANETWGLTPSPFDCWLAERGIMSFDLRLERAEANAGALAEALCGMPGIRRVLWPGRADHPDHDRATSLLGGRGGNMLSFEIEGGRAAANALVRAAEGLAFAPTLGDVSTTLSHPASSSHRAVSAEARARVGITEGFFRVSVGIEPSETLIAQMRVGLEAASAAVAGARAG
jgi:cystathionine gamma-synthase